MVSWKKLKSLSKQCIPKQAVLLTVVTLYLITLALQSGQLSHLTSTSSSKRKELNLILILCGGEASGQGGKVASDLSRQLRQAEVMLKSAVLFSKKRLHFHILADSFHLYQSLVNRTSGWPEIFRRKLRFSLHDVWYPEERQDMRKMFRVCATERLFIPDIFPKLDKAIYIDTDLIFLRPVEDLWNLFDNFNSQQISSMAPCLYHYGTPRNKVPFYGDSGLNAGIMHMDLDRMREIEGGWTDTNLDIYDKYKSRIKLADQDILNILFSFQPEKLYEMPCHFNYRVWQCSQGSNKCPSAADTGVSILHGNALAFVKGHEMKIQKIFEAFDGFELGVNKPGQLFIQIKAGLAQVDHEDQPSKCKEVPGIDTILLNQLKNHIKGAKLNKRF